jgi:probable F420-dependent oxidoreductase
MKIGLPLSAVSWKHWVPFVQEAEGLGYESVWLPEHLILPVQMSGSPQTGHETPPITAETPAYDVFVALASVAAATSRLRFGTNVYNVGLRHPFVTARAATTLDMLSRGRFDFGIGVGWLEEEWDAVGWDFSTRGRRVNETLEVCQRLWSADEDVIEHHGEFWDFQPVKFYPKTVQQPSVPVLVGGDGKAAKRRAVRFGTGWIPMDTPFEEMPAAIAELDQMRQDAGRTDRIEITVDGHPGGIHITSPDHFRQLEAMGIDRVILQPWSTSRDAIDGITRFAEEVLQKV